MRENPKREPQTSRASSLRTPPSRRILLWMMLIVFVIGLTAVFFMMLNLSSVLEEWAKGVFASCFLLLVVLALIYYWYRLTRSRDGS